jgi:hypothetical protein
MFDIRLASLEAFGRSIFDIVDQANLERALAATRRRSRLRCSVSQGAVTEKGRLLPLSMG